jgi:hypothetical protein
MIDMVGWFLVFLILFIVMVFFIWLIAEWISKNDMKGRWD